MRHTAPSHTGQSGEDSRVGRRDPPRLTGAKLGAAIVAWILGSAAIGGRTLLVARAAALAWASNTNEIATVIVAEVYATLIIALVGALGGAKNAFHALRVRLVPARAFVVAFGIFAVAVIVGNLAYALAGAGDALVKSYLLIGTDGGRLGVIGPVTTLLSVGRACLLAPIGEELLFRGAIYGWSRSQLSAWPAIVVNSVFWAAVSGGIGGSGGLLLIPMFMLNGFMLNWIRERTDSTVPGMALHMVHNIAVVIAVFLITGWR